MARLGRPRTSRDPNATAKNEDDLARYYGRPSLQSWAMAASSNLRRRAKSAGKEFTATSTDILMLATTHCPVLGIPLSYERGRRVKLADSVAIILIEEDGPWHVNNMVVVSWRVAMARIALPSASLIRLGQWLADQQDDCPFAAFERAFLKFSEDVKLAMDRMRAEQDSAQ